QLSFHRLHSIELAAMRFFTFSIAALASIATTVLAADEQVKVEVTRAVECDRKTQKGDKISVHYRGTLTDGKQFDASYDRGTPLDFVVGRGSVIKGWDENLLDMCIGEKRILTIPPAFGYGDRAMGPIPAGSTLIFETELMGIAGVEPPASTVEEPQAAEPESTAEATSTGDHKEL
ncbi:hypothetical protein F5884DRAFT_668013, partial [Xylogone sp. PMI_703]